MKAIIKVYGINSIKDVNRIKNAITSNEGIIACQILKDKREVEIVYDDYFVKLNNLIECIEDIGYTVL